MGKVVGFLFRGFSVVAGSRVVSGARAWMGVLLRPAHRSVAAIHALLWPPVANTGRWVLDLSMAVVRRVHHHLAEVLRRSEGTPQSVRDNADLGAGILLAVLATLLLRPLIKVVISILMLPITLPLRLLKGPRRGSRRRSAGWAERRDATPGSARKRRHHRFGSRSPLPNEGIVPAEDGQGAR